MKTSATTTERLLRLPEVRARVGFGTDSVYRLARAGSFPKPVKIGLRASAWKESEINAWIDSRTTAETTISKVA